MNKKVKILISVLMLVVLMAAFAVNSFAAVKCVNRGNVKYSLYQEYTITYPMTTKAQFLRVENVGTNPIYIYYGKNKNMRVGRYIDTGCSYEICFGGSTWRGDLKKGLSISLLVQNHGQNKFAYNIKTSSGTIK